MAVNVEAASHILGIRMEGKGGEDPLLALQKHNIDSGSVLGVRRV
jgi:hypothetical protein